MLRSITPRVKMDLPPNLYYALGLHRKAGPITSLHVFDFDGTLVRTPSPEQGKTTYLAAIGKPWKGGWWGKIESLNPPVFPSPCPPELIVRTAHDELRDVVSRSQTAVGVVVTGRIKPVRPAVLRILDEICATGQGSFLAHNAVFTHPMGRMTTLEFKRTLFKTLLTEGPLMGRPIKQLHIWEDRTEHAEVFATSGAQELKELTGVETTVHFVSPEMP